MLLSFRNLIVSKEGRLGIIQLNRPTVLNALNLELLTELVRALEELDNDQTVNVIVLTGGEKAFAAGADILEMSQTKTAAEIIDKRFELWQQISKTAKPIIAAVNGYCLGGGNELAMSCDITIASTNAVFGQPEVNLGLIPGAGGTQRLTRIVGKSRAMQIILTGKSISAKDALRIGLVCKIVPTQKLMKEVKKIANEIASKPAISVRSAKKAILQAHESTLDIGLEYERKLFQVVFATNDSKEGIRAFLEKRKPVFKGS